MKAKVSEDQFLQIQQEECVSFQEQRQRHFELVEGEPELSFPEELDLHFASDFPFHGTGDHF